MQRILITAVMAGLAAALPLQARVMAPPSVAERLAQADSVVIGKVVKFEEKTVKAEPYPGAPEKVEFTVAVVKVSENLQGAKGLTEIRVGFVKMMDGGKPRPRPFPGVNLIEGQEACFFLIRHPKETFYTMPNLGGALDKKADTYEKDIEVVKKGLKVFEDAKAALKAKDADDRFFAAALLLMKYRPARPSSDGKEPKTEPIDPDQSKLILETIADADWTKFDQTTRSNAQTLFNRLGVKPEDGWTPPKDFKKLPDEAKKWLKENAGKYRIHKFVAEAPK